MHTDIHIHIEVYTLKPTTAQEIPMEQKVFTDCWNLMKKYYKIEKDDNAGWDSLVNDGKKIYEQTIGTSAEELGMNMTTAVIDYIEKQAAVR